MALFLRLLGMSLLALTVVYLCLYFYARTRKREKLEQDWMKAGRPGDKSGYVDPRLETYAQMLRRRLIWTVYVLPLCGIAVLIYLTNSA